MNNLPDEYKTGNPGLDKAIARTLAKRPETLERVSFLTQTQMIVADPQNKYNVAKIEDRTYHDGTIFASRGELIRWDFLLKIQAAGEIKDLERQKEFILQEEFVSKQKEWGDQKPVIYVSDFAYTNISFRKGHEGRYIVEDVKGSKKNLAKEYKVKRRLFLYRFGYCLFFEVYPDSATV